MINRYYTADTADWSEILPPGEIVFVDGKQYVGDGETALQSIIPKNIINIYIPIPEAAISAEPNNQFPYLDPLFSYNNPDAFDWFITFPSYIEGNWNSIEDYKKTKEAYLEAQPTGGIYEAKNTLFFLEDVTELKSYTPFYLDIKVVKK